MTLSVYIHVPFCEVKCGYCDFYSVPRGYEDFSLQAEYVDALLNEISERAGDLHGSPIQSLFFGGGTPSLLDPKLLERIFEALARHFSWDRVTEITLESNPKTVSLEKLKTFRSLGVNRLSVGVQSFQERFLKTLGRIHDGNDARRTIHDAREAGFENVSCDLIFALPGQTFEDWRADLETALSLETDHLSAYHLTIESGTPFESLQRSGKLRLPQEEEGVRMLIWTRERLQSAGLPAYEISNFARPGRESVHNRNYWRYGDYLGFGTAAAGFEKAPHRRRSVNVRDLKKYLAGSWADSSEKIDGPTAMGEFCMLALRTREGIRRSAFASEFGREADSVYDAVLARWKGRCWLEESPEGWTLTPEGLLFTDEVAASFLP